MLQQLLAAGAGWLGHTVRDLAGLPDVHRDAQATGRIDAFLQSLADRADLRAFAMEG
jgi:hypothetical protein